MHGYVCLDLLLCVYLHMVKVMYMCKLSMNVHMRDSAVCEEHQGWHVKQQKVSLLPQ